MTKPNLKSSDIKCVLNPIKQSNIIRKTVEKTNTFDIKSGNIEHPETVTKLSKPKDITQKLKKKKKITQSQKPLIVLYIRYYYNTYSF